MVEDVGQRSYGGLEQGARDQARRGGHLRVKVAQSRVTKTNGVRKEFSQRGSLM